jgi:hypothetical protein
MPRVRGLSTSALALFLSGCPGSPTGEDATLEVRWWIYGQRPDTHWCELAGIVDVRMVEDGDPIEDFEWPCDAAEYVSDGPVLGAGEYFLRFEGVDETGYVIASNPDGDAADHVTVEEGGTIVLDQYDLDAGGVGDLEVPALFRNAGGEAVSCTAAGVVRMGYEFSVDACGEAHGKGAAVYADAAGGGVGCDAAQLSLSDVPFGVYTLSITAFAADVAWAGECTGLVLETESLVAPECVIERTE